MANYLELTLVGSVGKDATTQFTPQGIQVTEFNVAYNKNTGTGENRNSKVMWFRVKAWRKLAEITAAYVKKGMSVMVKGEEDIEEWIDKNGVKQITRVITASEVIFLSKAEGGAQAPAQQAPVTDEIPF